MNWCYCNSQNRNLITCNFIWFKKEILLVLNHLGELN